MQKLNYGTKVKIKKTKFSGRVVRFYEKSEKYVVIVNGKLFTHTYNDLKVVNDNFIKKLLTKIFK